jgi:hypothetical protein
MVGCLLLFIAIDHVGLFPSPDPVITQLDQAVDSGASSGSIHNSTLPVNSNPVSGAVVKGGPATSEIQCQQGATTNNPLRVGTLVSLPRAGRRMKGDDLPPEGLEA